MTIQGGNLHSILRTYNKQIKYGKIAAFDKSISKSSEKSIDKVSLSPEAKKVMFISNLISQAPDKDISNEDLEQYLKDFDFANATKEDLDALKENILDKI
jgi:hypothetical protein